MQVPGRLGHSQGNIPYQGRDCFSSFVIHALFCIILAQKLWFGEMRERKPRTTFRDWSLPNYTQSIPPKSVHCWITTWNKPSIRPSDPNVQVALISTSRITITTINTRSHTNSLDICWNQTFGAVTRIRPQQKPWTFLRPSCFCMRLGNAQTAPYCNIQWLSLKWG